MSEPINPDSRHRNDIYGDLDTQPKNDAPAIPAATVVLLRDAPEVEVLMVHKNSKIAFGGMWVFPGGRIDGADTSPDGDAEATARNAAARETLEEVGIEERPEDFVWFAHWTPPASTPKRFATWFFAARADNHEITIDGGEIQDHAWIKPSEAIGRHAKGEIDLVPPTWLTLHHLSLYPSVDEILERFRTTTTKFYETHVAKRGDGVRVAMWHGDAGYEAANADTDGARHRLVMLEDGFVFENTVEDY